jgi:hypothetical protein
VYRCNKGNVEVGKMIRELHVVEIAILYLYAAISYCYVYVCMLIRIIRELPWGVNVIL